MKLSSGTNDWWSATLLTHSGKYMETEKGETSASGDGTSAGSSEGTPIPGHPRVHDFLTDEQLIQLVDEAVIKNDKTLLKAVFDKYPRQVPNLVDAGLRHKSFLHLSCKLGHEEIAALLLNYGADKSKDVENKEGTPLKLACEFGHSEIVDMLISFGAVCPHPEISTRNPLYLAVQNGHSNVISCFTHYQNGELISGHYNASVLLYGACYYGHLELVKYFLDHCPVTVNAPVQKVPIHEVHNADKLTPMYAACKGHHEDIVYLLSEKGADITPHLLENFPEIFRNLVQKYVVPFDTETTPIDLENLLKVGWKRRHLHITEIPIDWLSHCLTFIVEVDISRNKLKYLPHWLPWLMPNITKFDASHNDLLGCRPPKDVLCEKLQEINLSHNSLDAIPMRVFQLKSLKYLSLKNNLLAELPPTYADRGTSTYSTLDTEGSRASSTYERRSGGFVDLTVAWNCDNLRDFDVSHNRLKELPIHIQNASRLMRLDVSYNKLTHFPAPWPCPMENLNVAHNELETFIQNVDTFWSRSLRWLRLDHNQLTEINQGMCAINTLTTLRLSHNKLKEVPATAYWKCSQLESLDLACNLLGDQERYEQSLKKGKRSLLSVPIWKRQKEEPRVPTPQIDLPDMFSEKLRYLSLRDNYLYDVPTTVFKMKCLETLDLRDNQITVLPNELGKLSSGCDLKVDDIAMKNIPRDVLRADPGTLQASRQVLTYLRTKLRKSTPYHRVKLVVVGKEGRGKTTLLSVLQGQKYEENVSTHGVAIKEWRLNPNRPFSQANRPPVTFSTWDMAGQKDYYVTHQCFLSHNALYLVVWDLTLHKEGVLNLRPWLLNIQARAPESAVIIIGTFLDRLDSDPIERQRKVEELTQKINELYCRPGFPAIRGISEVSCKTKDGISELRELIYSTALNMANAHSPTEKLLGRLVPSSYLALEKLVIEEAKKRKKNEKHPVLLEQEFEELVAKIPKDMRDIDTPEERNQVAKFLHETGILLHYSDQHRALNSLYFIDPSWLCDMLAAVINFKNVQNGMLKVKTVEARLTQTDKTRFPRTFFQEYLHLLERFDIGLQLDEERLLIPSKLAASRPAVTNGSDQRSGSEQKLYRWYKMAYVPSGFWSRLIVRILVGIRQHKHLLSLRSSTLFPQVSEQSLRRKLSKQWSLKGSHRACHLKDDNHVWWRHGIIVNHQDGYFIIESSSAVFADPTGYEGILVTVHSSIGNFSAMGFIADQIDCLIAEWFPGLQGINERGDPIISRILPCPYCIKAEEEPDNYHSLLRVCHFTYEDCAVAALENDNCKINCQKHPEPVPLEILVPDLLLADLPARLQLEKPELQLEETEENRLGQGGYASVYRAKYRGKEVAAKVFHSAAKLANATRNRNASALGETMSTEMGSEATESDFPPEGFGRSHKLNSIRASYEEVGIQAIQMFRELRSEVALMAKLRHPCIVTLIATSVKPPCFLLELAPMGSLQSVLQNEMNEKGFKDSLTLYRTKDLTQSSVFSKMLTYKLVLQIALAVRYLHKYNIIYRDLKCQNVLVWNLDLQNAVNVKLSDYGISCFNTPQGIMGNEGTPGYQAPEIKTGVAYDEMVDLFSLGMTIYEIISGHQPMDTYHYPGQIIQAVRKGERPSLKELNIDPKFPCLTALMEDCWHAEPECRPSAGEVVQALKRTEFVCQERLLPQPDQGLITTVDCIYAPSLKSKNQFVWIWGGQKADRVFSVLDVERGVFRANKKSCPGPKALCTTRVGSTMWVGNKDKEIEIFGYKMTGLPENLRVIHLQSTALHMLYETVEDKTAVAIPKITSQRVYVAQEKGIVSVFSCDDPVRVHDEPTGRRSASIAMSIQQVPHINGDTDNWALCDTLQVGEGENEKAPATCLEKVAVTDEIWVGCGHSIVVISTSTLKIETRIPLKQTTYVKQLKSIGKRVWCLQQWSCNILEFDAQTKTQRYLFNCSDAPINAVIAEEQFEPEAAFRNEDIENPVIRRTGSAQKSSSGSRGDRTGRIFTEVSINVSNRGEEEESMESGSVPKDRTADTESEVSAPGPTLETASAPGATAGTASSPGEMASSPGGVGAMASTPGASDEIVSAPGTPATGDFVKFSFGNTGKKNKLVENFFKNKAALEEPSGSDNLAKSPGSQGSNFVPSLLFPSLTKGYDLGGYKDSTNIGIVPEMSTIGSGTSTLPSVPVEKACIDLVKEVLSDRFDDIDGMHTSQTLPNQPTVRQRHLVRRRGKSEIPKGRGRKKFSKDTMQIMHQVRSMFVVRDQTLWIGRNSGDIIVVSIDDSSLCYNPYGQVLSVLETKDMEKHKNGRIRHLVGVGPDRVLATRLFHKISDDGIEGDFKDDSDDDSEDERAAEASSVYQLVVWEAYGCEEFYRVQTLWNQLRTAEIEKEGKF